MTRHALKRRQFLGQLGIVSGSLALPACGDKPGPDRYTERDRQLLERQQREESAASGSGPYGKQVFTGYRGLAALPWFELDHTGQLRCVEDSAADAIDVHCHLGMSVLFEPELDLQKRTSRVRHLLDCDGGGDGCRLDLDVYANSNFSEAALRELRWNTLAQGLWGSRFAETQTIPNLLGEMDAMRVGQAFILPIKMGMPFGDRLSEHWRNSIREAGAGHRLIAGMSIHPRGRDRIAEMRSQAAAGGRLMKLHPTVQSFYPDDPSMMAVYEEAQRLGLVIFFHGGRAGIEPESRLAYAMPRHYEAVLAEFPDLQVILGHAGARDGKAMLELAMAHDNAWLGIHGQGVTRLEEIINRTGGERLLFGTDWPFYHIGMSLAKVLICTEGRGREGLRRRILHDNARLLLRSTG